MCKRLVFVTVLAQYNKTLLEDTNFFFTTHVCLKGKRKKQPLHNIGGSRNKKHGRPYPQKWSQKNNKKDNTPVVHAISDHLC